MSMYKKNGGVKALAECSAKNASVFFYVLPKVKWFSDPNAEPVPTIPRHRTDSSRNQFYIYVNKWSFIMTNKHLHYHLCYSIKKKYLYIYF